MQWMDGVERVRIEQITISPERSAQGFISGRIDLDLPCCQIQARSAQLVGRIFCGPGCPGWPIEHKMQVPAMPGGAEDQGGRLRKYVEDLPRSLVQTAPMPPPIQIDANRSRIGRCHRADVIFPGKMGLDLRIRQVAPRLCFRKP